MTLHFVGQFMLITNQVRTQGQKWTVWKIKDTECGHGHIIQKDWQLENLVKNIPSD